MIKYFDWVVRFSLRLTWLALFVVPGAALMHAHVAIQRLAGQRVRPLPTLVYRSSGFLIAFFAIYAAAASGTYS